MFFNSGHIWLVLILLAVLVIFGPKRLPELGGAIGRALREFRQATSELREQVTDSGRGAADKSAGADSAPSAEPSEPAKTQTDTHR